MKFRDRRKRIFLPGAEEETNKWIKCHVCGFHINVDRLNLTEQSGDIYKDFAQEDLNIVGCGDALKIMSVMESFDMIGVSLELGPDGEPITTYDVPRNMTVGSGCPGCGSTNF